MIETEKASIANLMDGDVIRRIDLEIAKVAANILTEDTSATKTREITVKIKMKPAEDRSFTAVEVAVTSKLAPVAQPATRLFITHSKGQVSLVENNPQQPGLPMTAGRSA